MHIVCDRRTVVPAHGFVCIPTHTSYVISHGFVVLVEPCFEAKLDINAFSICDPHDRRHIEINAFNGGDSERVISIGDVLARITVQQRVSVPNIASYMLVHDSSTKGCASATVAAGSSAAQSDDD